MRACLLQSALLLALASPAWGQALAPLPPAAPAGLPAQVAPADGGSSEVLESIFVPSTKDAPFTLTLATEWVRPLGSDGNTLTLHNERRIARDREGRIYQERVLLRPPGITGPYVTNWIQIADPATHTLLNCPVRTKVCRALPYNPSTAEPELSAGTTKFEGATEQRQALGRDLIQGVEVVGLHTTTVIDAQRFGNSKPVQIEREFWYSPALQLNLKSMRDDPRSGRQTFIVTELSRDAPDPALMSLPAGYTLPDDTIPARQ